jgi:hypothetical protein
MQQPLKGWSKKKGSHQEDTSLERNQEDIETKAKDIF